MSHQGNRKYSGHGYRHQAAGRGRGGGHFYNPTSNSHRQERGGTNYHRSHHAPNQSYRQDNRRDYSNSNYNYHGQLPQRGSDRFSSDNVRIKVEDGETGFIHGHEEEPSFKRIKVEERPEGRAEYLKGVNADTWLQFTAQDHFESQFPGNDFRNFESIWKLIETNEMVQDDRIKSKAWLDRKIEKAEEVVRMYEKKYHDEEDAKQSEREKNVDRDSYSSDYSDDSGNYRIQRVYKRPAFSESFKKYILALPYNVVFDVGFHMLGLNYRDFDSCYCPCSRHMEKWRENFCIESPEKVGFDKDNCTSKGNARFSPKGLMDHLNSIGTDLHKAIRDYLELVYTDFWATNVSHEALYDVGTEKYKRSKEKFSRYFQSLLQSEKRMREEETEKRRALEEKIREQDEKLKQLQRANQDLYGQALERNEWYKVFDMDPIDFKKKCLSHDEYQRQCLGLRGTLDLVSNFARATERKINIHVTHEMTLQDIFDDWYDNRGTSSTTTKYTGAMYFRDLENDAQVFYEWNVSYADMNTILDSKTKKEKDKKDDLIAIDKGGPSKVLLNTFCSQIEDLVVHLPVSSDSRVRSLEEPDQLEYLEPKIGWKVKPRGDKKLYWSKGRILAYDSLRRRAIIKALDLKRTKNHPSAQISDTFELERERFQIIGIPIRLFEHGGIPCRDDKFQIYEVNVEKKTEQALKVEEAPKANNAPNSLPAKIQEWRAMRLSRSDFQRKIQEWHILASQPSLQKQTDAESKITDVLWNDIQKFHNQANRPYIQRQVEEAMALYYRAYGRILLHTIFDSALSLSQNVMPKFFRNVILRGITPQSDEYSIAELIDDLLTMKAVSSNSKNVIGMTFTDFFQDMYTDVDKFIYDSDKRASPWKCTRYDIKANDAITKENFKTKFVPLYLLETRYKALISILDGLNLSNHCGIHNFFESRPREVLDGLLFSETSFTAKDVTDLFELIYDENIKWIPVESHEQFLEQLKRAINELSLEISSFLVDFIHLVTGSEYLPSLRAHPDFKLYIKFDLKSDDHLPSARTCHNLISFPMTVYGNSFDVIKDRLYTSVKAAKDAGFGMN